jgi:predicted RNA-binding Zn ribbon-like protein
VESLLPSFPQQKELGMSAVDRKASRLVVARAYRTVWRAVFRALEEGDQELADELTDLAVQLGKLSGGAAVRRVSQAPQRGRCA